MRTLGSAQKKRVLLALAIMVAVLAVLGSQRLLPSSHAVTALSEVRSSKD